MESAMKKSKALQTEKSKKAKVAEAYNKAFMAEIQPKGGLVFEDKYVKKADGYETCLHVYDMKTTQNTFWLNQLMQRDEVIAVMDVLTAERDDILKTIDRSIDEFYARALEEKSNIEQLESQMSISTLQRVANEISQRGESIKIVVNRLYLSAPTREGLDKKINRLKGELTGLGYKTTILLTGMKEEWDGLFLPLDKQMESNFTINGKYIPARSLGGGYPFHHKSLEDPYGMYLGRTSTNGVVLFDRYMNDNRNRKYSHTFLFGQMRYGKSTLLKKLFEDDYNRDNFIRGFDKAGDFEEVVADKGGAYIDLAGKNGRINWLEVFSTATKSEKDLSVDHVASFHQHIAKCKLMLGMLNSDFTETDLNEFGRMLTGFYVDYGLWIDTNEPEAQQQTVIAGRDSADYPILIDLLAFMTQKYQHIIEREAPTPARRVRIEKIRNTLDNMLQENGNIFNGRTTVPNVQEEQVVFYDISGLQSLSGNVFRAQLYTAISMMWNDALRNGRKMKQLHEDNQIDWAHIRRFSVYLDECHNVINPDNKASVDYIIQFQREMPKFFGSVLFATQTIDSILKSNLANDTNEALKTIFALCQYKFFFRLDHSEVDTVQRVIGDVLTDSLKGEIPKLQQGETVLTTGATEAFKMKVFVSQDEVDRFKGGN